MHAWFHQGLGCGRAAPILGRRELQGHYFAKPLPDVLAPLLRAGKVLAPPRRDA